MCCCVCNLICKIISLIVTLLFIVAVILLILWGVGVIFGKDDQPEGTTTTEISRFHQMTFNNPKLI